MKSAPVAGSYFAGWARVLGAALAAAWLLGCDFTDWGDGDATGADAGGSGGGPATAGNDGSAEPVKTTIVDLVFVVEKTGNIGEEQKKLLDELPRMLTILTSGDLDPDDNGGVPEQDKDFPAATDLNLGVVSADMGMPGVQMNPDPEGKCDGFGDNGLFQHAANPGLHPDLVCRSSRYPLFLSYQQGQDTDALAADLQCIAALGTGGCGCGKMPLEAALKALWPADEENLTDEQKDLDIAFLLDDPPHGDREHLNFLRGTPYHPSQSDLVSVLAIIMLAVDDCSAGAKGNLDFFEHPSTAPPGIANQPICLRCYYDTLNETGYKHPVDRYISTLRKLRPGHEQLVVFGAITGVPPGMNEEEFDDDGDGSIDAEERDAYYENLLAHPLMQLRLRADGQQLEPACTLANPNWDGSDPGTELTTKAVPSRRITEVARGLSENGVVESICQEDFSGAFDRIIQAISKHLGSQP